MSLVQSLAFLYTMNKGLTEISFTGEECGTPTSRTAHGGVCRSSIQGSQGLDLMAEEEAAQIPNHFSGAAYDVVALAASAGGLAALSTVLGALPGGFPAAIVVVQHLDPRHRSLMADILSRRTPLEVQQAKEGDSLHPGTVYIAPPNRHLLVNPDGTLSLSQSELVHFVRPSADLLFDSLAGSYKERAIAVVLTGTGVDGNMGVQAIHKMGGTVLAQDEKTADFFGMPAAAIKTGSVDYVLPLEEIAPALVNLVMGDQQDETA